MGTHFFALAVVCCLLVAPAMAQESVQQSAPPSIQAGDWLSVNFRTKIQLDFAGLKPDFNDKSEIFQRKRVRLGADGTLFRSLDYSVTVETIKGDRLRDLVLKYHLLPYLQLQAGRFKIPFGLDQLTDSGKLDFIQRSRIGSILAPGRDTGAVLTGELLEGKLHYSAGVFRHEGKNSAINDFAANDKLRPGGNRTVAARVAIVPDALLHLPAIFRDLKLGAAVTRGHLITGLSSLPGVTVSNQVFFSRMYVNGARSRRGAELSWRLASFSVQSEFMDVREQRLGQGSRGEDLPPLRAQGWYLSVTRPLFGHIDDGIHTSFLRSLLPGKPGLFELVARYETIRFSSESFAGSLPSRNPRAANVVPNDEQAWTFGINWHANRYLKLQFNGMREMLRDPVRTPLDGENRYWKVVGRSQLFF